MKFRLLLVIILSILMSACATSFDKRGRYHSVRKQDSIRSIAHFYKVDVQDLAEYNDITDPKQLKEGMKLYIPPREKESFKKLPFEGRLAGADKKSFRKSRNSRQRGDGSIAVDKSKFVWPYSGNVTSGFGVRNNRRHDGIDIKGPIGAKIHAAASGTVVFSGKMRGYGNLVLIRHEDDYFTAYAHNKSNLVKKGQAVKKGQMIGTIGMSGRTTGSHLHFEIRNGQKARNPLFFLPDKKGGK